MSETDGNLERFGSNFNSKVMDAVLKSRTGNEHVPNYGYSIDGTITIQSESGDDTIAMFPCGNDKWIALRHSRDTLEMSYGIDVLDKLIANLPHRKWRIVFGHEIAEHFRVSNLILVS